jgi:hypothetical protein
VTTGTDDDETIKVTPSGSRGRPARSRTARSGRTLLGLAWAASGGALVGLAAALWILWPRPPPLPQPPAVPRPPAAINLAPSPPAPVATPAIPAAPAFAIQTANETEIREHIADTLTVFRFAPNPNIIVLDFPTLLQQGLMLDRVAALVEKAGLPRDRVLTDAELDAAIRERGDTIATFYYGHDYSAASLVRFFDLADHQHIVLNEQEEKLRALVRQLGWFAPGAQGGLISIPRVGADPNVTMSARGSILRHELSHGEFFSDPAYATYVRGFWRTDLTEAERAGMRRFLGSEDYDTADEELMLNEMQAYVMFTLDPQFFQASDAGMTDQRREQLQEEFLRGLDVAWLRDNMIHKLAAAP